MKVTFMSFSLIIQVEHVSFQNIDRYATVGAIKHKKGGLLAATDREAFVRTKD